jgi:hypothetical protein
LLANKIRVLATFCVIPILHKDALNLEKQTAKYAKEKRDNHLAQAHKELV